jgi:hypothetical protein
VKVEPMIESAIRFVMVASIGRSVS